MLDFEIRVFPDWIFNNIDAQICLVFGERWNLQQVWLIWKKKKHVTWRYGLHDYIVSVSLLCFFFLK